LFVGQWYGKRTKLLDSLITHAVEKTGVYKVTELSCRWYKRVRITLPNIYWDKAGFVLIWPGSKRIFKKLEDNYLDLQVNLPKGRYFYYSMDGTFSSLHFPRSLTIKGPNTFMLSDIYGKVAKIS